MRRNIRRTEIEGMSLTIQERRVLLCMVRGFGTDSEISGQLAIKAQSVRKHVKRLLKKFRVSSRVGLAVWAAKNEKAIEIGGISDTERLEFLN